MKLKCINQGNFKNITLGNEYDVITENENTYDVLSDNFIPRIYAKKYFEVIPEPIPDIPRRHIPTAHLHQPVQPEHMGDAENRPCKCCRWCEQPHGRSLSLQPPISAVAAEHQRHYPPRQQITMGQAFLHRVGDVGKALLVIATGPPNREQDRGDHQRSCVAYRYGLGGGHSFFSIEATTSAIPLVTIATSMITPTHCQNPNCNRNSYVLISPV